MPLRKVHLAVLTLLFKDLTAVAPVETSALRQAATQASSFAVLNLTSGSTKGHADQSAPTSATAPARGLTAISACVQVAGGTGPEDVVVDSSGLVYVGEDRQVVSKWSDASSGVDVVAMQAEALAVDSQGAVFAAAQDEVFTGPTAAGSNWSTVPLGQLSTVKALTFDEQDRLYVMGETGQVLRFERTGQNAWSTGAQVVSGQQNQASGLAVRNNSVYVSQPWTARVYRWDPPYETGSVVATCTTSCSGVAVDQAGVVYVADSIDDAVTAWPPGAQQGLVVVGWGAAGVGVGWGQAGVTSFKPSGIFATEDALYVPDKGGDRVLQCPLKTITTTTTTTTTTDTTATTTTTTTSSSTATTTGTSSTTTTMTSTATTTTTSSATGTSTTTVTSTVTASTTSATVTSSTTVTSITTSTLTSLSSTTTSTTVTSITTSTLTSISSTTMSTTSATISALLTSAITTTVGAPTEATTMTGSSTSNTSATSTTTTSTAATSTVSITAGTTVASHTTTAAESSSTSTSSSSSASSSTITLAWTVQTTSSSSSAATPSSSTTGSTATTSLTTTGSSTSSSTTTVGAGRDQETSTGASTTGTTSSTTTTTLPSPEEAAEALLGAVKETSAKLLGVLEDSNESTVVAKLPDGGTMAVNKLEDALSEELGDALAEALAAFEEGGAYGDGEGYGSYSSGEDVAEERPVPSVDVEVPGTDIDIALPVTVFASLQVKANVAPADIAMVVTAFDPESANIKGLGKRPEPEEGGVKVEVLGAASIDLRDLASGDALSVEGLRHPIQFSLGANFSAGMKCAFWDEEEKAWSTRGVWASRSNVPGEKIVCKTRHLSLFGVLLETLVEQLTCTNVLNLMNAEAFQEVLAGTWMSTPSAAMFGGILGLLLLTFMAAALVDRGRFRFKDEFLLVHMAGGGDAPAQPAQPGGGALVRSACFCWLWAQESDVLRQAVDDIASNWCKTFAEVRTAVESCANCLKADASAIRSVIFSCQLTGLTGNVAAKMLLFTSRRSAAAALFLSEDVVSFVLDDADLARFLVHHLAEGDPGWRTADTAEQQAMAMTGMRDEVTDYLLHMIDRQGRHRHSVVKAFLMMLVAQNPIGELFVMDIFKSCKQRVMIFSAQTLGALAVSCVFFEATGMAKGKVKGKGCGGDEAFNPTEKLARFALIALGCLLVAGLPVQLLTSLQTKKFVVMKSPPGSEAWRRQLKVWRFQERLVFVLGAMYISACIFYIVMFLANIGDEDHNEWSLTGLLTIAQDVLLIPFAMALLVPLMSQVVLHVHVHFSGATRESFTRHVRELLHSSSNAMLPIERL